MGALSDSFKRKVRENRLSFCRGVARINSSAGVTRNQEALGSVCCLPAALTWGWNSFGCTVWKVLEHLDWLP